MTKNDDGIATYSPAAAGSKRTMGWPLTFNGHSEDKQYLSGPSDPFLDAS